MIGFAVLLGIVSMTYLLAERSRAYFDSAIATRDQRMAAVELRNALLAAESSHRGFIYSGNEVYFAPFDTAQSQSLRWLEALERTLDANADSRPLVERLRDISTRMLVDMNALIEKKRERDEEAVAILFRTNRGKALMDEANVFFSGIILAADDKLTAGISEQRSNATWLRLVTIFGGIIIVLVVGYSTASVMGQARDLASAHSELAALNADLEQKVAARTADLAQANNEIQRFAYIVTHDLRAPLVNIMGFTSEIEGGIKVLLAAVEQAARTGSLPDEKVRTASRTADEDLREAIHFIRSSAKKMYRSTDGMMNDYHVMLYGSRAAGGFGLIFPEQVAIQPDGRTTPNCSGIYDDAQIPGLQRVTDIIKDMGSVAAIQLGHTGRKGSELKPWEGQIQLPADHPDGWQVRGPSAIAHGGPKYNQPVHAMSVEEIKEVHQSYADAAVRTGGGI